MEFVFFALTLLGVALFHHHAMRVALVTRPQPANGSGREARVYLCGRCCS